MNQKKNNPAFWMTCFIRGLFLVFCVWIFFLTLTSIQMPESMAVFRSKPWLTIILAAGGLTLFSAFCLLVRSRCLQKKKWERVTAIGCAVLIFLLQLLLIRELRIQLRYDSLEVFEEACRLLKTGEIANWDYFGANAHQRGTLYLTWVLLKTAALFHIPETMYLIYLDLWCMFFVDSCLLAAGWYIYKKWGMERLAVYALACLFHPFTYLWCVFYYTTIQCLPFMSGVLLLVMIAPLCRRGWQKMLLGAVLGIWCFVGGKLRPTVLIALMAWVITWIVRKADWLYRQRKLRKPDGTIRSGYTHRLDKGERPYAPVVGIIGAVAGFCAAYLCMAQLYAAFDSRMVTIETDAYERPMLFWVAMSAKGDGTWDGNDAEYLAQFQTKEEKTKQAVALLKERLASMGAGEMLALVNNKLRVTWAEGNDDAISENAGSLSYGILYDVTLGDFSGIFLFYCQIFRIFLFACVLLGVVFGVGRESFEDTDYMRLAVLGGILFHIVWEAKRLYSIPFMPFLLVLMIDGIFRTCGFFEASVKEERKTKGKHMLTSLLLAAAVLTTLFACSMCGRLTQTQAQTRRYAASQWMERCDIKRGLYMGESVRQEFMADRPFDTIGVQVRNYSWYYGKDNESQYRMTVTDSEDNVLREEIIYGKDFEDYEFCDTSFEPIVPERDGELYRFTIETIYADDISYLVFYKKASDSIDPYPWGGYVENGVSMPQADMTFVVYESGMHPFLDRTDFWFFISSMIFLQFFFILLLTKKEKVPII